MSTTDISPRQHTVDLENEKFAKNSSNKTVVRVSDDDLISAILSATPLAGLEWDSYSITYNSLTDVVEYFQGGLTGTLLKTFTQTYDSTRKKKVVSGVWT